MHLLITIGLIHIVALISPGPDFALILRCRNKRSAAFGAALGIALAIALHATLSITGISILIKNSKQLYFVIRFLGASYLLWLSWGAFNLALRKTNHTESKRQINFSTFHHGVYTGFLTNLLNPKALLFFIGLLSGLITLEVSFFIRGILIVELFLLSLFWFSFLAWFITQTHAQNILTRFESSITLLTALLFLGVSASIYYSLLA